MFEKIPEITVSEVKQNLDQNPDECYLLDVREQEEWDIAYINGAVLKPVGTLADDFADVPKDKKVFVYCKMGGRSAQAVKFLKKQGYTNALNIKGGIDAWAAEIDPSMPTY